MRQDALVEFLGHLRLHEIGKVCHIVVEVIMVVKLMRLLFLDLLKLRLFLQVFFLLLFFLLNFALVFSVVFLFLHQHFFENVFGVHRPSLRGHLREQRILSL